MSKDWVKWRKSRQVHQSAAHDLEDDFDVLRYKEQRLLEELDRLQKSAHSIEAEEDNASTVSIPSSVQVVDSLESVNSIKLTLPPPSTAEYYARTSSGRWDKQDFALICFATVTNFSNVGRKCEEHGGIVFVLMYAFVIITLALPITYMEMILGQFTQSGLVGVWRLCPLFKGVGVTLALLIFGVTTIFPVIVSWFLQYAILALSDTYIWSKCNTFQGTWNTPQCVEEEDTDFVNRTIVRASEEYYRTKIVGQRFEDGRLVHGLTNIGTPQPGTAYIVVIYALVLLVISFGPRALGRVVHISTAIPTLLLMVLLFRGSTFSGAWSGLIDFVRPDFYKLGSPSSWSAVLSQVLRSTQCGQGYYMTYAGYNNFHGPIFKYALLVICLDFVFNIIGSITVFSFLGHSGFIRESGVFNDTTTIVTGDLIAFELMPEAFSRISHRDRGNVYAFFFFVMIFLNTVDNVAMMIDILTTAVIEMFVQQLTLPKGRAVVLFLISVCSCIFNVIFSTPGGVYYVVILNAAFGGGTNYVICCFLTLFAIMCLFGEAGVKVALERMTGNARGFGFLRIVWIFYSLPFVGLIVFVSAFEDFFGEPLSYRSVEIPDGKFVVVVIIYASMIWIPVGMFLAFCKTPSVGGLQARLALAVTPEHEKSVSTAHDLDVSRLCIQCPCFAWFKMNTNRDKFLRTYEEASKLRRPTEELQ